MKPKNRLKRSVRKRKRQRELLAKLPKKLKGSRPKRHLRKLALQKKMRRGKEKKLKRLRELLAKLLSKLRESVKRLRKLRDNA